MRDTHRAASADYALHHVVGFGALEIALVAKVLHEVWVKAYGAGLHAAAAAYAGALLIASCVLFVEYQYAVCALHDHYLIVWGAKACHTAAHYYLAGIFGIAAALAYGVGNYGSHAKAQVGGLLYAALYGGDAADERLTSITASAMAFAVPTFITMT